MRIALFLLVALSLNASTYTIKFDGNTHISDDKLFEAIGVYNPYFFEVFSDKPSLKEDAISKSAAEIENFYRSSGFYKARVSYITKDSTVTYKIIENSPIIIKTIQINSILDVEKSLQLQIEDIFDEDKFAQTKLAIRKKYAEAGYCNAELESKAWVDIEDFTAHLVFEAIPLQKCYFGAIHIDSSANIDSEILEGLLYFSEGDEYSLESIRQSYESLYAKEAISKVLINDNERDGSRVPISISIEESEKPVRFSAGVGYSSDEGVMGQLGLKHRNILGNLKTLSIDSRYSSIKQELSSTLSYPISRRGVLGAEIGYVNEIFDGYKSESIYEKITASYFHKPISFMSGVLFDKVRTYDSDDERSFVNSKLFIPSPILEANIDTRDRALEPTSGYTLNAKLSGSAYMNHISDATYFKSNLSGSHISSIGDHIFGIKAHWGTLRRYAGELPSSYRFYAGGMSSNRAYTYRNLGPKNSSGDPIGFNSIVEGSIEYRFPIWREIRGVVFSDITYASEHFTPNFRDDGYLATGLGIRYSTPIGPIALDFGFKPSDISINAIHFRIGELF